MTLNEFTGINYPHESAHDEFYNAVIDKLGYENVKACVPFPVETLEKWYAKDKNLNFKMKVWDTASGFMFFYNRRTQTEDVIRTWSPLTNLLERNGITYYSNSENVSILKRCACRMVEEAGREKQYGGKGHERQQDIENS